MKKITKYEWHFIIFVLLFVSLLNLVPYLFSSFKPEVDGRRVVITNVDKKVKALLDTIAFAEGTYKKNGYHIKVGGSTFKSLADHPRSKVWIGGIANYSTAAGRYQFLESTWDDLAKRLKLKNFDPLSQDKAAIALIKQKNAWNTLLNKDFKATVYKIAPIWASLPTQDGSCPYKGQTCKSIDELEKFYLSRLQYY